MSKILISYRREDSADVTGRIYDRLIREFNPDSVFRDVDSIPFGVDFRTYLDAQVAKCQVFLAVIGPDWMRGSSGGEGESRLEDPRDYVRIEIESALKREIPVIPVLVRGASIPAAERLPVSIQDLSYRHGITVRADPDFHRDMDRLMVQLKQQIQIFQEHHAEQESAGQTGAKDVKEHPPVHGEISSPAGEGPKPTRKPGMVKVAKGPFLYGDDRYRETIEHDYWIGIYPLTNEEFRAFILTGGYENHGYWSQAGWTWKT